MLSLLVHFSVCLCSGKCYHSLSVVGTCVLLSMIVHTLPHSDAIQIAPTRSVELEKLENASSSKTPDRKLTYTVNFQSSSQVQVSRTARVSTLHKSASGSTPDLSSIMHISTSRSSKEDGPVLHSKLTMLSNIASEQYSSAIFPSKTARSSDRTSSSIVQSKFEGELEWSSSSVKQSTFDRKSILERSSISEEKSYRPNVSLLPSFSEGQSEQSRSYTIHSHSIITSELHRKPEQLFSEIYQKLSPSLTELPTLHVKKHSAKHSQSSPYRTSMPSTMVTENLSIPLQVETTKTTVTRFEVAGLEQSVTSTFGGKPTDVISYLLLSNRIIMDSETSGKIDGTHKLGTSLTSEIAKANKTRSGTSILYSLSVENSTFSPLIEDSLYTIITSSPLSEDSLSTATTTSPLSEEQISTKVTISTLSEDSLSTQTKYSQLSEVSFSTVSTTSPFSGDLLSAQTDALSLSSVSLSTETAAWSLLSNSFLTEMAALSLSSISFSTDTDPTSLSSVSLSTKRDASSLSSVSLSTETDASSQLSVSLLTETAASSLSSVTLSAETAVSSLSSVPFSMETATTSISSVSLSTETAASSFSSLSLLTETAATSLSGVSLSAETAALSPFNDSISTKTAASSLSSVSLSTETNATSRSSVALLTETTAPSLSIVSLSAKTATLSLTSVPFLIETAATSLSVVSFSTETVASSLSSVSLLTKTAAPSLSSISLSAGTAVSSLFNDSISKETTVSSLSSVSLLKETAASSLPSVSLSAGTAASSLSNDSLLTETADSSVSSVSLSTETVATSLSSLSLSTKTASSLISSVSFSAETVASSLSSISSSTETVASSLSSVSFSPLTIDTTLSSVSLQTETVATCLSSVSLSTETADSSLSSFLLSTETAASLLSSFSLSTETVASSVSSVLLSAETDAPTLSSVPISTKTVATSLSDDLLSAITASIALSEDPLSKVKDSSPLSEVSLSTEITTPTIPEKTTSSQTTTSSLSDVSLSTLKVYSPVSEDSSSVVTAYSQLSDVSFSTVSAFKESLLAITVSSQQLEDSSVTKTTSMITSTLLPPEDSFSTETNTPLTNNSSSSITQTSPQSEDSSSIIKDFLIFSGVSLSTETTSWLLSEDLSATKTNLKLLKFSLSPTATISPLSEDSILIEKATSPLLVDSQETESNSTISEDLLFRITATSPLSDDSLPIVTTSLPQSKDSLSTTKSNSQRSKDPFLTQTGASSLSGVSLSTVSAFFPISEDSFSAVKESSPLSEDSLELKTAYTMLSEDLLLTSMWSFSTEKNSPLSKDSLLSITKTLPLWAYSSPTVITTSPISIFSFSTEKSSPLSGVSVSAKTSTSLLSDVSLSIETTTSGPSEELLSTQTVSSAQADVSLSTLKAYSPSSQDLSPAVTAYSLLSNLTLVTTHSPLSEDSLSVTITASTLSTDLSKSKQTSSMLSEDSISVTIAASTLSNDLLKSKQTSSMLSEDSFLTITVTLPLSEISFLTETTSDIVTTKSTLLAEPLCTIGVNLPQSKGLFSTITTSSPQSKDSFSISSTIPPLSKDSFFTITIFSPLSQDSLLSTTTTTSSQLSKYLLSTSKRTSPLSKDPLSTLATTSPLSKDSLSKLTTTSTLSEDSSLPITITLPLSEDSLLPIMETSSLSKDSLTNLSTTSPVSNDLLSTITRASQLIEDSSVTIAASSVLSEVTLSIKSTTSPLLENASSTITVSSMLSEVILSTKTSTLPLSDFASFITKSPLFKESLLTFTATSTLSEYSSFTFSSMLPLSKDAFTTIITTLSISKQSSSSTIAAPSVILDNSLSTVKADSPLANISFSTLTTASVLSEDSLITIRTPSPLSKDSLSTIKVSSEVQLPRRNTASLLSEDSSVIMFASPQLTKVLTSTDLLVTSTSLLSEDSLFTITASSSLPELSFSTKATTPPLTNYSPVIITSPFLVLEDSISKITSTSTPLEDSLSTVKTALPTSKVSLSTITTLSTLSEFSLFSITASSPLSKYSLSTIISLLSEDSPTAITASLPISEDSLSTITAPMPPTEDLLSIITASFSLSEDSLTSLTASLLLSDDSLSATRASLVQTIDTSFIQQLNTDIVLQSYSDKNVFHTMQESFTEQRIQNTPSSRALHTEKLLASFSELKAHSIYTNRQMTQPLYKPSVYTELATSQPSPSDTMSTVEQMESLSEKNVEKWLTDIPYMTPFSEIESLSSANTATQILKDTLAPSIFSIYQIGSSQETTHYFKSIFLSNTEGKTLTQTEHLYSEQINKLSTFTNEHLPLSQTVDGKQVNITSFSEYSVAKSRKISPTSQVFPFEASTIKEKARITGSFTDERTLTSPTKITYLQNIESDYERNFFVTLNDIPIPSASFSEISINVPESRPSPTSISVLTDILPSPFLLTTFLIKESGSTPSTTKVISPDTHHDVSTLLSGFTDTKLERSSDNVVPSLAELPKPLFSSHEFTDFESEMKVSKSVESLLSTIPSYLSKFRSASVVLQSLKMLTHLPSFNERDSSPSNHDFMNMRKTDSVSTPVTRYFTNPQSVLQLITLKDLEIQPSSSTTIFKFSSSIEQENKLSAATISMATEASKALSSTFKQQGMTSGTATEPVFGDVSSSSSLLSELIESAIAYMSTNFATFSLDKQNCTTLKVITPVLTSVQTLSSFAPEITESLSSTVTASKPGAVQKQSLLFTKYASFERESLTSAFKSESLFHVKEMKPDNFKVFSSYSKFMTGAKESVSIFSKKVKLSSEVFDIPIKQSKSEPLSKDESLKNNVHTLKTSSSFNEFQFSEQAISSVEATFPLFTGLTKHLFTIEDDSQSEGNRPSLTMDFQQAIASFSEFIPLQHGKESSASTPVLTYIPDMSSSVIEFAYLQPKSTLSDATSKQSSVKTTYVTFQRGDKFALSTSLLPSKGITGSLNSGTNIKSSIDIESSSALFEEMNSNPTIYTVASSAMLSISTKIHSKTFITEKVHSFFPSDPMSDFFSTSVETSSIIPEASNLISTPCTTTLDKRISVSTTLGKSLRGRWISLSSERISNLFTFLPTSFTSVSFFSTEETLHFTPGVVLTDVTSGRGRFHEYNQERQEIVTSIVPTPSADISASFFSTAFQNKVQLSSEKAIYPSRNIITTYAKVENFPLSQRSRLFSGHIEVKLSSVTLAMTSLLESTDVASSLATEGMDNTGGVPQSSLAKTSHITVNMKTALSLTLSSVVTSDLVLPKTVAKTNLESKKIVTVSSLTIGILVKIAVNISSNEFEMKIKEGLKRCYYEGIAKGIESNNRRKRDAQTVTVQVTNMHRNPERPKNVNVEFYVLVDGKAQPIAQVFAIFSRLTIAETSAYLSFPVIANVKVEVQADVEKPTDQEAAKASFMTYVLVGVTSVGAVIATIILAVWYCQKEDPHSKRPRSSLEDADLKIDIEKGEVVSVSVGKDKNLHPYVFDHGKDNSNYVLQHFEWNLTKATGERKIGWSPKGSISEIHSASQRLKRLRKLGFRGSEIRKPGEDFKETCSSNNGYTQRSGHTDDNLNVINDLDKTINPRLDVIQKGLIHESSSKNKEINVQYQNDKENNTVQMIKTNKEISQELFQLNMNIKPNCHASSSCCRKVNDSLLFHSSDINLKSDATESAKVVQFKRSSEHRKKKKLRKTKTCKSTESTSLKDKGLVNLEGSVQSEIQGIPEKQVEGFRCKVKAGPFYESLLFENDSSFRTSVDDNHGDEIFLADKVSDLSIKGSHGSERHISDAVETFATIAPRSEHRQKQIFSSSGNYCDIIRACDSNINSSFENKLDMKLGDSNKNMNRLNSGEFMLEKDIEHSSDNLYDLKFCDSSIDGSEYAGHEFESLNFTSEYTVTDRSQRCEPDLMENTAERRMTEQVIVEHMLISRPQVCEHVTKMGRIGKKHVINKDIGPQFHKVQYQDQEYPTPSGSSSTPEHQSSRGTQTAPRSDLSNSDSSIDGSEYAGHEFEFLNFTSKYTVSDRSQHCAPYLMENTAGRRTMAQMMVEYRQSSEPYVCEHVTKMGRFGKKHVIKKNIGPQFRKVQYQDQEYPTPSPEHQSSRGTQTETSAFRFILPKVEATMDSDHIVFQDQIFEESNITGKHIAAPDRKLGLNNISEKKSSLRNGQELPLTKNKTLSDVDTSDNLELPGISMKNKVSDISDVAKENIVPEKEVNGNGYLGKKDKFEDKQAEKKRKTSQFKNSLNHAMNIDPKQEEFPKVDDVTGRDNIYNEEPFIYNVSEDEEYHQKTEPEETKDLPELGTITTSINSVPYFEEVCKVDHTTGGRQYLERKFDQGNRPLSKDTLFKNEEKQSAKGQFGKQVPSRDSPNRPDCSPYSEVKLGRNMRAAPKGSIGPNRMPQADSSQQLLDATEPLLHGQPLPSNDIVDYYTNTQSAGFQQSAQGTANVPRQYPVRSMTCPQHPSQHLIETLNRNSHTSLTQPVQREEFIRPEIEQQPPRIEQEPPRREQEPPRIEPELPRREQQPERFNEDAEAQNRPNPDFDTEQTFRKMPVRPNEQSVGTVSDDITSPPPPPVDTLYGDSASFNRVGEISATTSSFRGTVTQSEFSAQNAVSLEIQETGEEVEEIAEEIHEDDHDDESDDNRINDDDFEF